jgi:hypothetical protein
MKTIGNQACTVGFAVSLILALAVERAAGQESSGGRYAVRSAVLSTCSGHGTGTSHGLSSVLAPPAPPGTGESLALRLDSGYVMQLPAEPAPQRLLLAPGWNLKGSPVTTADSIDSLFRDDSGYEIRLGDLYFWGGDDYEARDAADVLPANEAFWVFSYWGGLSQEVQGVQGSTADLEDQLAEGWNLYSPTYHVTVPSSPDTEIVIVWHWNPVSQQYDEVLSGQNLFPLEGYWIYKRAVR